MFRNRRQLSFFIAAIALLLATPTFAIDVGVGYAQGPGGYYKKDDSSGPYAIGSDGVVRLRGGQTQGANNFVTSQVTVNATSTPLVGARNGRGAVTVMNLGTTAVYVGPSGVTSANGFLIPGTVGASVTIPTSAAVFAVSASGTQGVSILETY